MDQAFSLCMKHYAKTKYINVNTAKINSKRFLVGGLYIRSSTFLVRLNRQIGGKNKYRHNVHNQQTD